MMTGLRSSIALVSIASLTFIAVLPWGIPMEDRFVLPLLPVIAIHFWALRTPDRVPEWFVFAAGLTLDVLTHGPLGYWALIYLIVYAIGLLSEPFGQASRVHRIALFFIALGVVTAAAWFLASAYFMELADWQPYLTGAGLAVIAGAIVSPVLHVLDPSRPVRDNPRLARGV